MDTKLQKTCLVQARRICFCLELLFIIILWQTCLLSFYFVVNEKVKSASVKKLATPTTDVKKSDSDVCKQSSEEQRDEMEELVKKLKTTRDKIEKDINRQINTGIVMYILCSMLVNNLSVQIQNSHLNCYVAPAMHI